MIRLINEDDLPQLRQWKNAHKEAFFYKDEISEEQQIEWFREYQTRPDDHMFMVLSGDGCPIGCIGVRLVEGSWDVYNVILGVPEKRENGLMSLSLKDIVRFATNRSKSRVTTKVLKDNPAIDWYIWNGFEFEFEHIDWIPSDYYTMTYKGEA